MSKFHEIYEKYKYLLTEAKSSIDLDTLMGYLRVMGFKVDDYADGTTTFDMDGYPLVEISKSGDISVTGLIYTSSEEYTTTFTYGKDYNRFIKDMPKKWRMNEGLLEESIDLDTFIGLLRIKGFRFVDFTNTSEFYEKDQYIVKINESHQSLNKNIVIMTMEQFLFYDNPEYGGKDILNTFDYEEAADYISQNF
jgi:hypothetical protein